MVLFLWYYFYGIIFMVLFLWYYFYGIIVVKRNRYMNHPTSSNRQLLKI
jgi:hypothetical protein